jgi:transposase
MLQPVVRRTWSPRGETAIIRIWDRHDRLSAISTLTIPPRRCRLCLHFEVLDHNVRWPDVHRFLSALLGKLRRPLTVVLGRLSAHRAAAKRLKARFGGRIEFEWLPAYAPQLKPVEHVWGHTKYGDLADYVPEDMHALKAELSTSPERKRGDGDLLRSFFRQAELEL